MLGRKRRPEIIPPDGPKTKEKKTGGRRDTKSAIGPLEILRIQAALTGADGVVDRPRREGAKAGGYFGALLEPTPQRPKIVVIAIRRGEDDTMITVGIRTRHGDSAHEVPSGRRLTAHNTAATAQTIGKLLHTPQGVAMCQRELEALLGEPVGTQRSFTIGAGNRLMIEKG